MFRIRINPVIDMETLELLSHDGEYFVECVPIKFDRSIAKTAKSNAGTASTVGGGYGTTASQIGSELIPGLESQMQHPQGFDPTTRNNMLVAGQEAAGGANAGLTGEANLTAMRTRNPAAFGAALDEAARQKGRQLSTNALNVQNADAALKEKQRQQAQQQLQGLYNTDTSRQLESMGLANQDLRTALEAGQQGWMQDLEGLAGTAGKLGLRAATGGGG